jgi:hypothetical protein
MAKEQLYAQTGREARLLLMLGIIAISAGRRIELSQSILDLYEGITIQVFMDKTDDGMVLLTKEVKSEVSNLKM